jgi:hypothetical protein
MQYFTGDAKQRISGGILLIISSVVISRRCSCLSAVPGMDGWMAAGGD